MSQYVDQAGLVLRHVTERTDELVVRRVGAFAPPHGAEHVVLAGDDWLEWIPATVELADDAPEPVEEIPGRYIVRVDLAFGTAPLCGHTCRLSRLPVTARRS